MTNEQRERSERERSTVTEHGTLPSSAATHELVRARAYELFEERGAQHGADVDDWLRAEREVRRVVANRD